MRRLALLAVSIAGLALAASALAKDVNPVLDAAAISSAQCMTPGSGAKQVVDVRFQLTNYADSGYVGAWAWDTVNRHLRIWKQAGGVFCAQISDDGSKFVTIGGFSPAGGGNLNAGVTGTFTGGYIIAGINGRFDPHYKKSGDLGSFDAKCDTQFTCNGAYPSWISYFNDVKSGGFSAWGWLYDAGTSGKWLDQANISPPHGGDIRSSKNGALGR